MNNLATGLSWRVENYNASKIEIIIFIVERQLFLLKPVQCSVSFLIKYVNLIQPVTGENSWDLGVPGFAMLHVFLVSSLGLLSEQTGQDLTWLDLRILGSLPKTNLAKSPKAAKISFAHFLVICSDSFQLRFQIFGFHAELKPVQYQCIQ